MSDFIPVKFDGSDSFTQISNSDDLKLGSGILKTDTKAVNIANIGIPDEQWFTYDGTNNIMTLTYDPIGAIMAIYNKAEHLEKGVDFTISGKVITFDVNQIDMVTGDRVLVYYYK